MSWKNKKFYRLTYGFVLALLVSPILYAETPLRLETTLEPRTATVGDPLRFVVRAVAETGVVVEPFVPETTLGSFDVLHFEPGTPRTEEGRLTQDFTWTLACYEVGTSTVPAMTISWQWEGKTQEIKTPEIPVTIRSIVPPDSKGIRGLKRPWRGPVPWLLWLGVVLGVGVLGGVVVWWLKRRRATVALPPPRPAHELALEALDDLEKNPPETARVFYTTLSGVVRTYVEGRFRLPAQDLTTNEIMDALKKIGLDGRVRRTARELLESSDLVKFARFDYGPEGRREHLTTARDFVRATQPDEEKAESL